MSSHRTIRRWRGTISRWLPPAPALSHPVGREGEETEGPSFAAIREAHGALLDRVAAAIRVRGLAIRTEQT